MNRQEFVSTFKRLTARATSGQLLVLVDMFTVAFCAEAAERDEYAKQAAYQLQARENEQENYDKQITEMQQELDARMHHIELLRSHLDELGSIVGIAPNEEDHYTKLKHRVVDLAVTF